MAAYTYKLVSALVPQQVKDSIEDYEGTCDYDGDLWIAAAAYIEELQARIAELEQQLAAATEREREAARLLMECNQIIAEEFPVSRRGLRAEIDAALAASEPKEEE